VSSLRDRAGARGGAPVGDGAGYGAEPHDGRESSRVRRRGEPRARRRGMRGQTCRRNASGRGTRAAAGLPVRGTAWAVSFAGVLPAARVFGKGGQPAHHAGAPSEHGNPPSSAPSTVGCTAQSHSGALAGVDRDRSLAARARGGGRRLSECVSGPRLDGSSGGKVVRAGAVERRGSPVRGCQGKSVFCTGQSKEYVRKLP
jgi:hypothetical protein